MTIYDSIEIFIAVFTATILAQVALEMYNRWVKEHTNKALDKVDAHIKTIKETFKEERP